MKTQEKKKHISILKSFIVLQKSNYYLTRKKDKWQVIYNTNARPAHTAPRFTWLSENKSTFSFQTARTNLSGWIWGLIVVSAALWGQKMARCITFIRSAASPRPSHYNTGSPSTWGGAPPENRLSRVSAAPCTHRLRRLSERKRFGSGTTWPEKCYLDRVKVWKWQTNTVSWEFEKWSYNLFCSFVSTF